MNIPTEQTATRSTKLAVEGYTDSDVKEYRNIIDEYLRGHRIQMRFHSTDAWEDVERPTFNFGSCSYRVKPKLFYRPICDHVEILEQIRAHGGYVRHIEGDSTACQITSFNAEGVQIDELGNTCYITFKQLFNRFTWAYDNHPCGIAYENE